VVAPLARLAAPLQVQDGAELLKPQTVFSKKLPRSKTCAHQYNPPAATLLLTTTLHVPTRVQRNVPVERTSAITQDRTTQHRRDPTTTAEAHRLLLHAAHVHRVRTAVAAEEDDQKTQCYLFMYCATSNLECSGPRLLCRA
jgi:hypothetical protein